MPGGAPPAMQFQPLQYAQPATTTADAMKGLGKNLASANKVLQQQNPAAQPAPPGTAVQTPSGGTIMMGGPQGPAPFPGGALPGTPYSNQAGPVAPPGMNQPPPGAGPPPSQPMVPNQPPGGAMVGGPQGQPGAPGQSPVGAMAQQPGMLQNLIRSIMGGGGAGGVTPNGVPGSAALNGAGMLAPTMNNPSAFGGG